MCYLCGFKSFGTLTVNETMVIEQIIKSNLNTS